MSLERSSIIDRLVLSRFITSYHTANFYIVTTSIGVNVAFDFGEIQEPVIFDILKSFEFRLDYLVLTHEHIDHCAGLNILYKHCKPELLCHQACGMNIRDSKQNLSFYHDRVQAMSFDYNFHPISDGQRVKLGGVSLDVIHTPGHSPGSTCYKFGDLLFTGDTFMQDFKTPLSFPHSRKSDYDLSIQKLKGYMHTGVLICPGHGAEFNYEG